MKFLIQLLILKLVASEICKCKYQWSDTSFDGGCVKQHGCPATSCSDWYKEERRWCVVEKTPCEVTPGGRPNFAGGWIYCDSQTEVQKVPCKCKSQWTSRFCTNENEPQLGCTTCSIYDNGQPWCNLVDNNCVPDKKGNEGEQVYGGINVPNTNEITDYWMLCDEKTTFVGSCGKGFKIRRTNQKGSFASNDPADTPEKCATACTNIPTCKAYKFKTLPTRTCFLDTTNVNPASITEFPKADDDYLFCSKVSTFLENVNFKEIKAKDKNACEVKGQKLKAKTERDCTREALGISYCTAFMFNKADGCYVCATEASEGTLAGTKFFDVPKNYQ